MLPIWALALMCWVQAILARLAAQRCQDEIIRRAYTRFQWGLVLLAAFETFFSIIGWLSTLND